MKEPFTKPTRILLPTDLSSSARGALRYAAAMAEIHRAELHILHVLTVHDYDPVSARQAMAELQEALETIEADMAREVESEAEGHKHRGVTVRSATVRSVSAFDAILGYAEANDIDQIVMGTHGRTGLKYVLLGSVTEKTVRHAHVPVLVVGEGQRAFVDEHGKISLGRIMYCTDLSPASRIAAPRARNEANAHGAELLVCHVLTAAAGYDKDGGEHVPEDLRKRVNKTVKNEADGLFGTDYNLHVEVSTQPVARALAEVAKRKVVDLIVMSSQGRQGLQEHFIGSVAERLVRLSPCPICIIKQKPTES